jgi:tetratricopeptide (TPR) repeat protein/transcriptional regulator with XRE-family HTH domain
MIGETRNSNRLLRYQREQRGWTQARLAEELYQRCEDDSRPGARGEINAKMIGAWERGEHVPSSYYQEKLRLLFAKSAEELGFIESLPQPGHASVMVPSSVQQVLPALFTPHQAIDFLCEASDEPVEQHLGAWLALGAAHLAPLFASGWSLEDMLTSLKLVLPGVQAMSKFSRRTLFQLGAAAVVSNIPIPEGKHISAEDRARLCQALGDNIAAVWKLLYSISNAQLLAVAHAQLFLVQQNHTLLYPQVRSLCYAGVYGQIGIALHFQERDAEALQAYRSFYIAALEAGEPWYVAQSLICQADSYHALGQYGMAIQAIEEALRVIGNPTDEIMTQARAHLLTCWADNVMMLEDYRMTQEKLDEAEVYLDQIIPNEEFDQASWLLIDGKYALKTGSYSKAKDSFEKALKQLPDHWVLRRTMTAIGLAMALAHMRERKESIAIAEQLLPMVKTVDAQLTNRWFHEYLQQDLLGTFPTDNQVHKLVTDTYKQFPRLASPPLLRS